MVPPPGPVTSGPYRMGRPPRPRTPPSSPPLRRAEVETRNVSTAPSVLTSGRHPSPGPMGMQRRRRRRRVARANGSDNDSDDFLGDVPRAPPEEPDDAWDYFQDLENRARQRAASEGPGRLLHLKVMKW